MKWMLGWIFENYWALLLTVHNADCVNKQLTIVIFGHPSRMPVSMTLCALLTISRTGWRNMCDKRHALFSHRWKLKPNNERRFSVNFIHSYYSLLSWVSGVSVGLNTGKQIELFQNVTSLYDWQIDHVSETVIPFMRSLSNTISNVRFGQKRFL